MGQEVRRRSWYWCLPVTWHGHSLETVSDIFIPNWLASIALFSAGYTTALLDGIWAGLMIDGGRFFVDRQWGQLIRPLVTASFADAKRYCWVIVELAVVLHYIAFLLSGVSVFLVSFLVVWRLALPSCCFGLQNLIWLQIDGRKVLTAGFHEYYMQSCGLGFMITWSPL